MCTFNYKILFLIAATFITFSCGSNSGGSDYSVLPVRIGEKWGYVTTKGEYVVNPSLNEADYFSDGLARVKQQGKVGYINQKGKYVIPCEYIGGTQFNDGKAFVTFQEMYPTCINKKGKKLFQVDSVEYVRAFSDGFAMIVTSTYLYGFINDKGKKVIKPQYAEAHDFSEGLAAIKSVNKWGFINGKGDVVIEPQYSDVGDFKEGLAFVQVDGQYGYIDKKGKMVINPQFDGAANFSEGLACVKTGGSYGFINDKGSYAINPQFEEAESFRGGLALIKQGSCGYINTKGKIVINPTFLVSTPFLGDYAFAYDGSVSEKIGTIDKKGKTAIVPQFDDVRRPDYNKCLIRSNYYDASAFIEKLFEGWTSNSFFGLDANKTLGDTRSKFSPEKGPADSTYAFTIKKPEMVNGVALKSGVLGFDQKTYKMVDNIVDTGWFRYKSGKKRQYLNGCKLKAADFIFKLEGIAEHKEASLAHAIADEISSRLGDDYAKMDDCYIFPLTAKHPGYIIKYSTEDVTVKSTFEE